MSTIYIPEGRYQEPYTPAAGRITSTALSGVTLKYAKFMVSEDSNVTWKDLNGNTVTAFPCKGGIPYPFLVSVISASSAGTVLIIHDGIKDKPQPL